ncbi:MAG: lactate racemase domain-containing protein [Dehalobacterium sp.]
MVSEILKDVKIPRMVKIRQVFPNPKIEINEIPGIIYDKLNRQGFKEQIKPGMRIAITAGSRGVANIALVIKTIADFVKDHGGEPFVIPAMGSHGGATAEGQIEVLRHLGVTEEYLGCAIISSMEVKCIGKSEDGYDVYSDKIASESDGIIVIGRIKAHTDFTGPYESGIMKMMTIGMGNHIGASNCHELGFKNMHRNIPAFGKTVVKNMPVLFAVTLMENPYDETYRIELLKPEAIEEKEPELLAEAKTMMPMLYIKDYDILIVDKVGKNISGCGMDPHITGTYCSPYAWGAKRAQRIAVLDLTDETGGCATGVGYGDATTKRLWEKTDLDKGYPNSVIAHALEGCKIPMILENDKEAIQVCIKTCEEVDKENIRIIRIQDTLHMEHIMVSEALLYEAESHPNIVIESEPFELEFNIKGDLW